MRHFGCAPTSGAPQVQKVLEMIIRSLILSLVLCSVVDARPRLIRPAATPTAPVEQEVIQEEVDVAQVMRLGDCVQHCDGLLNRASPTDSESFIELMSAVPPDDMHKWFVSVVGDGGPESRVLREQWKTEPHLLALADPGDGKNSWAHINFYDSRDGSQQFRFENVQFTHFPTVIVQPPRSKEYGDPSTVVYQSSYSGDPHHLSTNISQAIQFYVSKLDQRPGYDSFRAQTPEDVESSDENIGADPPWDVPPAESDGRRRILFPDGIPVIPPREGIETVFKIPWGLIITALTGGASVPVFIGLGIWLVRQIRARRKADGKKLILDDETLERIFDVLETLSQPKVDEEEEEEKPVAKKKKKTRRR